MNNEKPRLYNVPGLTEALRSGDKPQLESLLASVPNGEVFCVDHMLLTLSDPTEDERQLITRSLARQQELGIVTKGNEKIIIEGENKSVLTSEVTAALEQLDGFGGERIYAHTHWDTAAYIPPSPGDRVQFMIYWRRWPDLKCRIVFPFKESAKVLNYLGELVPEK